MMHKRLFNEAGIRFTIIPTGPILIKASEGGADPTRPDMEFVRTHYAGHSDVPYLPGSSLKGVLRAHCERIVRTLDRDQGARPLACDPLDGRESCSSRLEGRTLTGEQAHARSCFICQFFGNTSLAGHLRTADAYPKDVNAVRTEERDGVAIDRVFGSVAVGPFQLEVVTQGEFETRLYLKNFTIAQLGLIGLALRDLKAGRVGLGFGKSRGLGAVTARLDRLTVRYPTWSLLEQNGKGETLPGVATFIDDELAADYGYLKGDANGRFGYASRNDDAVRLPDGLALAPDGWLGAELDVKTEAEIEAVWRACMAAWKKAVGLEP
jgi:CRISPR/Cas system CSM-associated protein Csm3 (group 7 of RAMP superfamily)